jgi:hypothetical protein
VIALACLAMGLIYFLREVILATNSLTFGGVRPVHLEVNKSGSVAKTPVAKE